MAFSRRQQNHQARTCESSRADAGYIDHHLLDRAGNSKDLAEVRQHARRIAHMDDGRIVEVTSPGESGSTVEPPGTARPLLEALS